MCLFQLFILVSIIYRHYFVSNIHIIYMFILCSFLWAPLSFRYYFSNCLNVYIICTSFYCLWVPLNFEYSFSCLLHIYFIFILGLFCFNLLIGIPIGVLLCLFMSIVCRNGPYKFHLDHIIHWHHLFSHPNLPLRAYQNLQLNLDSNLH